MSDETDTRVLAYARVSTPDQALPRQVRSILPYAEREFDADLDGGDVDEIAEHVEAVGGGEPVPVGDVTIYHDKSTGTSTDRSGYKDMMARAENEPVTAVVTHSVSRISRSISDLDRTANRLADADVPLHIKSEGLTLSPDGTDPYTRAMFNLLGTFAQLEADLAQTRTKEGLAARKAADGGYHHGRAPLGFEKEDGKLYENDDYQDVVKVLDMVQKGELSKRKGADRLKTSRKTINRALDRPEMYGL